MYLFSYNQNNFFYYFRYFIYYVTILNCLFPIFLILYYKNILSYRFDEKEITISSKLRKYKKNIPLDIINKVLITNTAIWLFGIKKDKDQDEFELIIPLIKGGFIHKDDFLYILNLFKDKEIEYDDITQAGVLNMLTKKSFNNSKLIIYILFFCFLYLFFYRFFLL